MKNKQKIGALAMTGILLSSSLSPSLVLASTEEVNTKQANTSTVSEDNNVSIDKSIVDESNNKLQNLPDTASVENGENTDTESTLSKDNATPMTNLANFYVDLPRTGAYNGRGTLNIRPFAFEKTNDNDFKLYDLYIVIPLGLSIDGGVEALSTAYNQYLATHPMISSNPSVEALGNTLDGREVYKITTNGTATAPAPDFIDIPIKITEDTSITEIHSNAGKQENNKNYGVVYAGINDDSELEEISFYPHKDVSETVLSQVGVSGIQVATIVGDAYVRTMTLFKAKTLDTYILKEKNTGEILGTKEIQGESGDSYSRVGLIDKASLWTELDTAQYDINTYNIQDGEELAGDAVFSPEGTLGGDPNTIYSGHTYELYVNKFAEDVTVRYQDEEGNELDKDVILSGHVGEEYTIEQKEIPGYTLKEIQGNASGTFSDQPQEVVYVYERTDAAPVTVKYHDEEGNDLSPADTLNGKIGLPYESQPKSINGWTVKTTPSNASGKFTDQPQEVVYVYERTDAAPVTVKYHDEEGNQLSPADTLNGKIGLPYESQPKSINGWTVKTTPSNASGKFSDQPQEVVYVYVKDTLIDTGTSVNTGTPNNTEPPSNHEKNSNDTLLPSTGESKGLLFSIFGALLLILASLSVFLKKKSK
ncbi:MucBP domain-containing protein [Lactococcus garvieae]|uniref:MucBP domain-containing protein n=1 Tax=Lactococcus garvieae TaxID=1363 RepID=UPI0030D46D76